MAEDSRQQTEAQADRCLRRGELAEAMRLYSELTARHPHDATLAAKVARIRESIDPSELRSAKVPVSEQATSHLTPTTPEQEGERLFALGDYAGAAAAYRRALHEKPDSVLVRERLDELFRLAQAAPRHSPTDSALPEAPEPRLQALLDRISARRKVRLD
jgi:hypothetical protein